MKVSKKKRRSALTHGSVSGPSRGDRAWLLDAQSEALGFAAKIEGAVVLWPPRLTDFPPRPQHIAKGTLKEIDASSLRVGEVHAGCCLQLTTISQPSLCGNSVLVVVEDVVGTAVRLVVHYFTSAQTLGELAAEVPQGTRIQLKEPYFDDFVKGGPAICCAQPGNIEIQLPERQSVTDSLRSLQACEGSSFISKTKEGKDGGYDLLAMHQADAAAPTRFQVESYVSPCVIAEDLGVRGYGVIAQAYLPAGELVMASKAEHIVFNQDLAGRRMSRAPGWDEDGIDCAADTILMQSLASRSLKNKEKCAALLGLSHGKCRPEHDDPVLLQLQQIVKTNRFSANHPWDGAVAGTGLWLQPARLNHACDANCSWCTVGDMLFIRCQREILSGEELTIPYCDPTDRVKDRRDYLFSHHGFICQCTLCESQAHGGNDANKYEMHVEKAQACENVSDWKGALLHRTAAFKFLSTNDYCAQRQPQTEHAMAANAACQKLGQPKLAMCWLQKAQHCFALQWGEDAELFRFYASQCGVIGADFE